MGNIKVRFTTTCAAKIAVVARDESLVQEKFKSRHGAGEGTAE